MLKCKGDKPSKLFYLTQGKEQGNYSLTYTQYLFCETNITKHKVVDELANTQGSFMTSMSSIRFKHDMRILS